MRSLFLLIAVFMMLVPACTSDTPTPDPSNTEFSREGELDFLAADGSVIRTIEIEIAQDAEARQTGLMYRRKMTLNQGMLFLFDDAAERSFWMANTPLPLDIMFVDPDSQVINIAKRTKPLSRESVTSTGPAQYVVEVRGGFSDRFGISDSTRVRWRID